MMHIQKTSLAAFAVACVFVSAAPAFAQTPSFRDVPQSHIAFDAVEYLKAEGIIAGYADGTLKPDQKIDRAAVVKILISPLVTPQQLGQFGPTTVYQDIPSGAWYLPYVEAARQAFGIVDGPPKKSMFYGERNIQKAEFLKMLLIANKADAGAFGEIRLPLATDVANPDEWYYPYMRYAISSSLTLVTQNGLLSPGRELTRGDVALFMHRYAMYKEGRRTQALLDEAEYASVRSLLAARGAHASRPDESIVKAAVKTTESFRALVRAYRSGVSGDLDNVIALAGEAWNLAEQAKKLDMHLSKLVDQVQATAKNMADSARALKAGGQP